MKSSIATRVLTVAERYVNFGRDILFSTYPARSDRAVIHSFEIFSASQREALASADDAYVGRCLMHEFRLPGMGWTRLDRERERVAVNRGNQRESRRLLDMLSPGYRNIEWAFDPFAGKNWPQFWGPGFRWYLLSRREKYDPRATWELGRMHHLLPMALEFANGGCRKAEIAREFQDQIIDFLAQNPPGFGIHWVSPMEAAIRAINWCMAWSTFSRAEFAFPPGFVSVLDLGLRAHANFILRYLESGRSLRNNHYLANVAGLVFLWLHRPCPEAPRLMGDMLRSFFAECTRQFHPDGSNFEGSTAYHCFATQIVLATLALLSRVPREHPLHGSIVPVPGIVRERMAGAIGFARSMDLSPGCLALIGDDDGGRVLDTGDSDSRDTIGSGAFHLERLAEGIVETSGGDDGARPERAKSHDEFGVHLFERPNYRLLIRAGGKIDPRYGGHVHDDQLSILLSVRERPVLIDPGAFIYLGDPEQRKAFRASGCHNTLSPGNRGQHRWGSGTLFSMNDPALVSFEAGKETFSGELRGDGYRHRRTLTLTRDEIIGEDECDADGGKIVSFLFHPAISLEKGESVVVVSLPEGPLLLLTADAPLAVEPAWWSPRYGTRSQTLSVRIRMNGIRLSWRFVVGHE